MVTIHMDSNNPFFSLPYAMEMLLGNPAKSGGTLGFVLFSFSIIRMTLLWCALAIVSYNVSYMLVIWVALLMIWVLYFLNLQYDVNHIY